MSSDRPFLPIKVVLTREGDVTKQRPGGSPRKVFGEVTSDVRATLSGQLSAVADYFAHSFRSEPDLPGVGRVVLREKALAKSHRPAELLSPQTCPVIGVAKFGDLLVGVRPEGLRRLRQRIETETTKGAIASISAIDRIEPYRVEDVLSTDLRNLMQSVEQDDGALKLKLFRHHDSVTDDAVLRRFLEVLKRLNLREPKRINYGEQQRIFRVQVKKESEVVALASFIGSQSLSPIPHYSIVRAQATPVRSAAQTDYSAPIAGRVYPVVGIIDSGTDPADPALRPWLHGREEYVLPADRDHSHGSFVAGLLTHGRALNHGEEAFPDSPCKFVDVVALPGRRAARGLSEDDLVAILDEVVPKYPEVKVWNLSLSTKTPCIDSAFSDLGTKLDELQDRHDVTFVLAAGNFDMPPLRGWPPDDVGEADRICPPADSLRGITVASLAHLHNRNSRVTSGNPSPFSRRGPGPVFVPKPELGHVGGNCDKTGNYAQTGVLSFDGRGNIAEDIGTSFATPLVSGLVGNLREVVTGASRNLVKALLVQAALLRTGPVTAHDLRYRGFGQPPPLAGVLSCESWGVTLVFEPDLTQGFEFQKRNFPIPGCLRTPQGVHGEFVMTLVYDPPLDSTFGAEYVRTNVEVSLGTYDLNNEGNREHRRRIPQEPGDVSKLYEKHLVEHGFKWSPVKVYRRRMSRVEGDEWRLHIEVHNRAGAAFTNPQGVALLVTMLDPEHKAPVYDETVRLMAARGWATHDLEVRERLRLGP